MKTSSAASPKSALREESNLEPSPNNIFAGNAFRIKGPLVEQAMLLEQESQFMDERADGIAVALLGRLFAP